MDNTKKTIIINPELFKTKNTTPKQKPKYNPNSIKKTLLHRLKQHNRNMRNDNTNSISQDKPININEFDDSLKYLSELSLGYKKRKAQQYRNNTIKNKQEPNNSENVNINLPNSLKTTDITHKIGLPQIEPPYGNLKNGKKPTFRVWKNQTMKNSNPINSNPINSNPINSNPINSNPINSNPINSNPINSNPINSNPINSNPKINSQIKLDNTSSNIKSSHIKRRYKRRSTLDNNNKMDDKNIRVHHTTLKNKHILGKHLNRKVSILLKNRQTRKNIERERNILKQKSIIEVKHYLRKHGLLKIGSNAPDDIIRKLYESAFLTGDITNNNKDVLIHNFMNDI